MDKELVYVILLPSSVLFWLLGGKYWKGFKRFILPFLFLAIMIYLRITWWKNFLTALLCVGAFSLGYGETKPYWYKFLVGCAYSLATLPLGLSLWQIILPVIFIITFWLSNNLWFSKVFLWKICEGITGLLIGINIAYLIAR